MKLQMLTTKCCKEQKRDKKTLHKKKRKQRRYQYCWRKQTAIRDDAQALSTKEAELKVAQLNLAAENHLLKNERTLCCNKS